MLDYSAVFVTCSSQDEFDDEQIGRILLVTQFPSYLRKHPGGDRTGSHTPRSKLTTEWANVINDGLFLYECDLRVDDRGIQSVGAISYHIYTCCMVTSELVYVSCL